VNRVHKVWDEIKDNLFAIGAIIVIQLITRKQKNGKNLETYKG
jgi:hypothetical protein